MSCRFHALFVLLLASATGSSGCIIPHDFERITPDVRFNAKCACTVCLRSTAEPFCDEEKAVDPPVEIFECANRDSNPVGLKAEFDDRCQSLHRDLTATIRCELVIQDVFHTPLFPPDARYLGLADERACHVEDGKFLSSGRLFNSVVTIEPPSVVRFRSDTLAGEVRLSGRLAFSGGNCRAGRCPISIHWIDARGDDVALLRPARGRIRQPAVINTTPAVGECFGGPDVCIFRIPAGGIGAMLTGTWNDNSRRMALVVNDRPAGGIINYRTREVLVSGLFQTGGSEVHLNLHGHLDNLAPRVALPVAADVPCVDSQPCGIEARADDADGPREAMRFYWFIDGTSAPGSAERLATSLREGAHSVRTIVVDRDGAMAEATTTVNVAAAPAVVPPARREGQGPRYWIAAALGAAILALLAVAFIRRRRKHQ